MKHYLLIMGMAALGACAAPVAPVAEPARPSDTPVVTFDSAAVRSDLVTTIATRLGQSALDRTHASPTHLIAKVYPGMSPPPPPDAGPDWRPPSPSAALVRDGSRWMVVTATGTRAASAEQAAIIDGILANPAFWDEPLTAPAGCTDAGGAFFLLKVPGKSEIIRRGVCVGAPLGEKLAYASINA